MELHNDFRVSVGPTAAWKVLSDVERIAPLLPGAQLQEVEGDDYRGIVKVKVGPITAQYKGTATFVEQDETAGRMVLKATGRDTRGQGNANAMITVTMSPDGDGTKVTVATDLTITGKVAQFGRGVLADVSGKLVTQFVDALEKDLESGDPVPVAGVEDAEEAAEEAAAPLTGATETTSAVETPEVDTAETSAVPTDTGPAPTTTASTAPTDDAVPGDKAVSSGPRRIDSPEPEPVDLLDAAGGSVAKRLVPLIGVALAIALVVILRRRRTRTSGLDRLRSSLPELPDLPSVSDLRGHLPAELPSVSDLRGHLPAELPSVSDLRGHLPAVPSVSDLRAYLPDRSDLPSVTDLGKRLPELPELPDLAAAQQLGRRAAKQARKAARRR
jgi:carbon monoxide dehydrogenase subunit G